MIKKVTDTHKAVKEPYLECGRAVDAWKKRLDAELEAINAKYTKPLTAFLDRRAQEERQRQIEAARIDVSVNLKFSVDDHNLPLIACGAFKRACITNTSYKVEVDHDKVGIQLGTGHSSVHSVRRFSHSHVLGFSVWYQGFRIRVNQDPRPPLLAISFGAASLPLSGSGEEEIWFVGFFGTSERLGRLCRWRYIDVPELCPPFAPVLLIERLPAGCLPSARLPNPGSESAIALIQITGSRSGHPYRRLPSIRSS